MNKMMMLLAACGAMALAGSGHAEEPESPAAAEHHIYLHVVQPKDAEGVKVFVLPAADVPAPVETVDEPVIEEEPVVEAVEEPAPMPMVADEEIMVTAPEEEQAAELECLLVCGMEDVEVEAAVRSGAPMGLLLFIFVLAIFLGFELISKVPSQLHTPLMSGSNAISGITIVGALAAAGMDIGGMFSTILGTLAVAFASINVVGGYLVTDRMLGMFKKKDGGRQ
jgi:NAD(P) transhydrogenase subunit alpha